MSHYQAYLKAVGTPENSPKRVISAPLPTITRKPAKYTTMPHTAGTTPSSKAPSASPSTSSLRHSTTSPISPDTPITPTDFPQAPTKSALAAHPPNSPMASTPTSTTHSKRIPSPQAQAQAQPQIRPPSSLSDVQISKSLSHALALLQNAITYHAKRPFSALLLAPDHQSILLSHFSISHIRHAESELARLASDHFSPSYLAQCTLVSTWEPCAMCAGTIYWAGIGRVVYAAGEERLRGLTGEGNGENMTMDLPCRSVLQAGQRRVEVIGPVPEWEEKVVVECARWWSEHGGAKDGGGSGSGSGKSPNGHGPASAVNGYGHGHLRTESGSVATTWTGEESVLSSIGEDGEYKADLDIDWMR